MIQVHHLNKSRSQRVLWLLEELGLEYDIVKYLRDPKTMLAPLSLKKIHPLGKSPVITDNGKVIAESGCILNYLVHTYGKGKFIPPADTDARLSYEYWMHYAEGSAMPPLLMKLIFVKMPKMVPFFLKPLVGAISNGVQKSYVDPQLEAHMDFWESSLDKTEWFAGKEFSAADIQMSFPLEAGMSRGPKGGRPKVAAFVEKVRARPAYKKAMERGGDKDMAF